LLLGAVLPDTARAMLFIFPYQRYQLEALHVPFTSLVMICFIALLVPASARRGSFLALLAGTSSHYLLDLFQYHFAGGYYWFFPFSLVRFEIGLINPEDSLTFLPFLLLAAGILAWRDRRRAKRSAG